jgi:hypothetical protein
MVLEKYSTLEKKKKKHQDSELEQRSSWNILWKFEKKTNIENMLGG